MQIHISQLAQFHYIAYECLMYLNFDIIIDIAGEYITSMWALGHHRNKRLIKMINIIIKFTRYVGRSFPKIFWCK